jgi:hypothetical protein
VSCLVSAHVVGEVVMTEKEWLETTKLDHMSKHMDQTWLPRWESEYVKRTLRMGLMAISEVQMDLYRVADGISIRADVENCWKWLNRHMEAIVPVPICLISIWINSPAEFFRSIAGNLDRITADEHERVAEAIRDSIPYHGVISRIDPDWVTADVAVTANRCIRYKNAWGNGRSDQTQIVNLKKDLVNSGCMDQSVLGHLDMPTHTKACWVVDLIRIEAAKKFGIFPEILIPDPVVRAQPRRRVQWDGVQFMVPAQEPVANNLVLEQADNAAGHMLPTDRDPLQVYAQFIMNHAAQPQQDVADAVHLNQPANQQEYQMPQVRRVEHPDQDPERQLEDIL